MGDELDSMPNDEPTVALRKLPETEMPQQKSARKSSRKRPAKKRTDAKAKAAPHSESTRRRATRLALNLIEFQKVTFDNAARMLGAAQQQTEKAVQQLLGKRSWMPKEGQKAVDEWIKTVRHARGDFKKTVDKSFDLLSDYLKRLEKSEGAPAPKAAKKKTAKRRAKKKAA